MLKDAGDKMSDADKAPIQSAVDKVKKAKEGDDLNALRSAFGELEQAAHAMAAAQQSRSQGGAGPQGGGPTPPTAGKKDGDDVVDAEFEVK
jgi:molecular chaperone DnaK